MRSLWFPPVYFKTSFPFARYNFFIFIHAAGGGGACGGGAFVGRFRLSCVLRFTIERALNCPLLILIYDLRFLDKKSKGFSFGVWVLLGACGCVSFFVPNLPTLLAILP